MPSEFDNVVYYETTITVEGRLITSENMKVAEIARNHGFEFNGVWPADMMLTCGDANFQPLRVATDAVVNELRAARFFIRSVRIAAVVYEEKFT